MPGNIAIVGAPKAGKSELAKQLARYLNEDSENRYAVIDNVADGSPKSISKSCDVAVGLWAPYIVNSMIAAERTRRETANSRRGFNFVSVGTLLDTIVYQSCHSARMAEQTADNVQRSQIVAGWLGLVMFDMWPYEHVFYLESQPILEMDQLYDQQLIEALSLYSIPYARLRGTFEETLEQALPHIEGSIDSEDAPADERGVRPSGQSSEQAGDSPGPVSGVSDEARSDRSRQLPRTGWGDVSLSGGDAAVRLRALQDAEEALPGSEHSG